MKSSKLETYFLKLVDYSRKIIDALPIESTPQPLDYAIVKLKSVLDGIKDDRIKGLEKITRPSPAIGSATHRKGVGMNTIGLLTDRLVILIIKEWCLRNKANPDIDKADELYNSQTLDIIEALANAEPGSSALNSKITNIKADTYVRSWEEAYYGLFSTNLLMWESQEILYIKDITKLPCEDLRNYVKWFSLSNIMRNEYIQHCEMRYWTNEVKGS